MSRKISQVTIDGKTYSVTPWSGTKGARMLAKLVKLLGPALGKLMSSGGSINGLLDSKAADIDFAGVFVSLAERIDDTTFDSLIKEILEGVHEGPRAVADDFDSRFSGESLLMFKLVKAALEVNYGDFLSVIGKSAVRKANPAA